MVCVWGGALFNSVYPHNVSSQVLPCTHGVTDFGVEPSDLCVNEMPEEQAPRDLKSCTVWEPMSQRELTRISQRQHSVLTESRESNRFREKALTNGISAL